MDQNDAKALTRRWECRYSSAEMMYLTVNDDGSAARMYLHHSPDRATIWSAADVLDGNLGSEVKILFGQDIVQKLQAAVRALQLDPIQPEIEADKELRRGEAGPPSTR